MLQSPQLVLPFFSQKRIAYLLFLPLTLLKSFSRYHPGYPQNDQGQSFQ